MNQIIVGSGNLGLAVKLPDGEDLCEWVAVNTVDFYNQIKLVQPEITLSFNLLYYALWQIYLNMSASIMEIIFEKRNLPT